MGMSYDLPVRLSVTVIVSGMRAVWHGRTEANRPRVLASRHARTRRLSVAAHLVLVRHGETEWSREGRHTGRTDVPLTELGRAQAVRLREALQGWSFAAVLVSPLQRARETCDLAGLGDRAQVDLDLAEWDYGSFDGLTLREIREKHPGWTLWKDGPVGGETLAAVVGRAERVIERVTSVEGDVVLFAHGHLLRVLTARWLELTGALGQRFVLGPAAPSVLGSEHGIRAMLSWNVTPA